MRRVAAIAVVVALAACGSGSGGGGGSDAAPASKAAWMDEYGVVVTAVETAVDRTQAATRAGEPLGIRTACEGLRDSVAEAREAPAVPDAAADESLRGALDQVGAAAADCVRAMTQGDTRLLERSIVEIREARLVFDTAKSKLQA